MSGRGGGGGPRAAILVVLPAPNPTGLHGPAWRRRLDGQVRAASPWAGIVIRNVGTRRAGGGEVPPELSKTSGFLLAKTFHRWSWAKRWIARNVCICTKVRGATLFFFFFFAVAFS